MKRSTINNRKKRSTGSTSTARVSTHVDTLQSPSAAPRSWRFHLYSLWLFTFSDLKTIVGPKTVFGMLNALAAPIYGINTETPLRRYATILVPFYLWVNLLPFVIDNQRRPESILEDQELKNWRPLPSHRLTPQEARAIMLISYPTGLIVAAVIGGWRQSAALMILGYWYNSGGGSGGVLSKNFINACGFLCFASGAMEVALGQPLPFSPRLAAWCLMISGVVFTTVQTQDIPDQAGDALCGRKTVPIFLGDVPCRILTALFMAVWSLSCPLYWNAPSSLFATFFIMGNIIGVRCFCMRKVDDDKRTFQLWNGWMMVLYAMPLVTHLWRSPVRA